MDASDIDSIFYENPFIAILRGIRPDEVIGVAEIIVNAGWRCIEVPLNSPSPLESVGLLHKHFGNNILTGAGTVTTAEDVRSVINAGGRLIVAPNMEPAVIQEALMQKAAVMPGFMSATEAFQAYKEGARYLKLFPADAMGPAYIKAIRSVLPADARIVPVGGVSPENVSAFRDAGSAAFGIGSQLYKPGMSLADIRSRADAFSAACKI